MGLLVNVYPFPELERVAVVVNRSYMTFAAGTTGVVAIAGSHLGRVPP